MYRNLLTVDGEDAYLNYGAFIYGSLKDVVAFAPMKSVKSNDWAEEDGTEPDLSESGYRVDARSSISLSFGFHGANKDIDGFLSLLSDGVYHTFKIAPLTAYHYVPEDDGGDLSLVQPERSDPLRLYDGALVLRLRLVSNSSINDLCDSRVGAVTLKFSDDDYRYSNGVFGEFAPTVPADGEYLLNGRPFTDYNVVLTKGTLNNIRKISDVKHNLSTKYATQNGLAYDGAGGVVFKSRDVKLNCLMRAATPEQFWQYHQRFFNILSAPGGHTLYVEAEEREYEGYYKSCSVTKFYTEIGGIVWFEFTLTFTITGGFHDTLLAVDGDRFVFVDEGRYVNMESDKQKI
ncbi:MAG: hypothetical protein NC324_03040 [Bacteroides sp.]|nr:hypothetical protein [Bacteroides sp.]